MKEDECVLGLNPAACPHKAACRYWNSVSELCQYREIKEEESRRRHEKSFEDRSTVANAVRVNKA